MRRKLHLTQSKNTRVWITELKDLTTEEKAKLVEKVSQLGAFIGKRHKFSTALSDRLEEIKFNCEHIVIFFDETFGGWRAVVHKYQYGHEDVGGTCFTAKHFLDDDCDTIVTLGV